MQFLYKIPGYILLLFGGFCLSWGGFIVRSFQEADVWQILFLRSFFFIVALILFLSLTYKNKAIKVIKDSGVPGILGGFVMSFSFVAFIIAMDNTTVANVVFIISTQTMFLAIFGFFYLKEKISLIQVGEQQLLIGITAQSIQTLLVLDEPIPQEDVDQQTPIFQALLKKALTKA